MRYEADMVGQIKMLLYKDFQVDCADIEFSAGYGIADVVGVRYNKDDLSLLATKLSLPITNQRELAVLDTMPLDDCVSAGFISEKTVLSVSYVRRLLRSLVEKNHVVKSGRWFVRTSENMLEAELVVSVEAKLKKWREALGQAKRYQYFSNIVFVALPSATVTRVDRALFRRENIGVIEVDDNRAHVVMKPQRIIPKSSLMYRYCCQTLIQNNFQ